MKRIIIALVAGGLLFSLFGYSFIKNNVTVSAKTDEVVFPYLKKDKMGFINARGWWVIRPIYEAVESFSDGVAAVKLGSKWGFIDVKGKEIVPLKFSKVGSFNEGLAFARYPTGAWTIINKEGNAKGKTIFDPQVGASVNDISSFRDGLALVKTTDKKYVFIDSGGKTVGDPFEEAKEFNDGMAVCRPLTSKQWIFINPQGAKAIPLEYPSASSFSEGLAAVTKPEGKDAGAMGFIDKTGAFTIQAIFNEARPFSDGIAWVKADNACGAIGMDGLMMFKIPCQNTMGDYHEKLAWILYPVKNMYGVLDDEGVLRLKPEFYTPPVFKGGLALVAYGPGPKKIGYVDNIGRIAAKFSISEIKKLVSSNEIIESHFMSCHFGEFLVSQAK